MTETIEKIQYDHIIGYVGDDEKYWKTISTRIELKYSQLKLEYKKYFVSNPKDTQRLLISILNDKPKILYIDYTIRLEEHIALTNLIKRDNTLKEIAVCGLVDGSEYVKDCLAAGADFIHVKCGEYYDIVFDTFYLAFPKSVKGQTFAKAVCEQEILIIDEFRIGYISPTHIHVETNLEFCEGDQIHFETQIPRKNVPSKEFRVDKVSFSDLYYDYAFGLDLKFKFVDKKEFDEEEFLNSIVGVDSKQKIKLLKEFKLKKQQTSATYDLEIKQAMKKHRDWIYDNMLSTKPKEGKVLIVDSKMSVFSEPNTKPLDEYPFVIRCLTRFDEGFSDIDKIMPNVIVIQCLSDYVESIDGEDEIFNAAWEAYLRSCNNGKSSISATENIADISAVLEELKESGQRELEQVQEIIEIIKDIENYSPFIILFNCPFVEAKAIKETYMYPMVATYKQSIDMQSVITLSSTLNLKQKKRKEEKIKKKVAILKKKDPKKYGRLTIADFEDKFYFVSRKNKLCYVSYSAEVILETLTESIVTISTIDRLQIKSYQINYPIYMSIRLVPYSDGRDCLESKGRRYYKGLIHSIGENERKTLRRFINDIYGSPLKEKQKAELEEFRERQEAARLALETEEDENQ